MMPFFFFLPPCLFIWNIVSLLPDSWLTLLYLSLLKFSCLLFNAILTVASLCSLSSFSKTCLYWISMVFFNSPLAQYLTIHISVVLLIFLPVCKLPNHCIRILLYFTVSCRFYTLSTYFYLGKFELKNFQKIPKVLGCAEVSKLYITLEMW